MVELKTGHGILMSVAVIIWFPLGIFLLRLLRIKRVVIWHALWQGIGLVMLLSGFGTGRRLSDNSTVSERSFAYYWVGFEKC